MDELETYNTALRSERTGHNKHILTRPRRAHDISSSSIFASSPPLLTTFIPFPLHHLPSFLFVTSIEQTQHSGSMAGSTVRTSFGYNKSTPTSSPRSSPPSTLSSGKSRLPVYSRSNSSTPHRPISGPTTATRINLTPIINNRTPSPHPTPDEGPQVKVVYGRVDVSSKHYCELT